MKTKLLMCMTIFVSLFSLQAQKVPEISKLTIIKLNSPEKMKDNGEFVISIWKAFGWEEVDRLGFDRFLREREVDLTDFLNDSKKAIVRIQQRNGGAAHIDSILLGDQPPSEIRSPFNELDLKKLSKKDMDVLEATRKRFELVFPTQSSDRILRLTARVEHRIISRTPFQFPLENLYHPGNRLIKFYSYEMGRESPPPEKAGSPDYLNAIGGRAPFFKVFSAPISGHPSGFTYGWVSNDKNNLYVTLDFTADNTSDGDKDYAKVYVQNEQNIREFKVSARETDWGRSYFAYTDKVDYQHKVYDFVIPISELDANDAPGNLKLAFAAYGTSAALASTNPALAFDPFNNRYLLVYSAMAHDGVDEAIYGQLVNADGTPFGYEFLIADPIGTQIRPGVAFGNQASGFLVFWLVGRNQEKCQNWDIYAQRVSLAGTRLGSEIVISSHSGGQYIPDVAFDSGNLRFLVVWQDLRDYITVPDIDIYGQLVNADGTLVPGELPIFTGPETPTNPAVAYDSLDGRYLIVYVWGNVFGQMLNADGSPYGPSVTLTDAGDFDREHVSVANDSRNHRFMVTWNAWEMGSFSFYDIYGQLVDSEGQRYPSASSPNFLISAVDEEQQYPVVAYHQLNQNFLTIWNDYRNFSSLFYSQIYGQLVGNDGTLLSTTMNENFSLADVSAFWNQSPALAYNSICGNFLAVWSSEEFYYYPDIYAAVIGTPCPDLPTVITSAVTQITGNSALSGGNVTDDGGADVTQRGVCWNTTGQPTVSDSHTADGSGTGIFSSLINGLTGDSTYFIRAYATNYMGTGYGNELTFSTKPDLLISLTASAVTDDAWIIHRNYGSLDIFVENPAGLAIEKFIIYRKENNGAFQVRKEFFQSELTAGLFHFNDLYLESAIQYTYKVEAFDSQGVVIGYSNEVTI